MAMDSESDDSERWEDFFGSTTDLTPSLIGFYDTLTGNNKLNLNSLPSNATTQIPQQQQQQIVQQNSCKTTTSNTTLLSTNELDCTSLTTKKHTTKEIIATENKNLNNSTEITATEVEETSIVTTSTSTTTTTTSNYQNSHTKLFRFNSDDISHSNISLASSSNSSESPTSLKLNNNFVHSQKQYRSFKNFTPNLQRIISNSNTVVESDTNLSHDSYNSDTERTTSPINSNCIRLTKRILGKQKTSCIPLSKNTCKLSQAGTDIDGKCCTYVVQQQLQQQQQQELESLEQKKKNIELETLSNKVRNLINTFEFTNTTDSDKTPTNSNCNNFQFESQPLSKNNSSSSCQEDSERNSSEQKNVTKDSKITDPSLKFNDKELKEKNSKKKVTINTLSSIHDSNCINKNDSLKNEMENSSTQSLNSSIENTNDNNKKLQSKTFCKSPLQLRRSIKPNSPILTYARVKMLANKSSVQKLENTSSNIKNSNDLIESIEKMAITTCSSNNTTAATNDINDTTIINNSNHNITSTTTPTANAIKSKQQQHQNLRKINSLLQNTDVANLKCRPLSSSSICSTSSNTSSSTTGSSSTSNENHINGKSSEVTSYLASVESLADHSEGELNSLSSSSNNTLSVLERSCLEIIDSERSYVEDLRQIIQGYLLDWKRRKCLKSDEIKILFSNIEDIYEFNTELLDRLLDSEMDQVKISKCFTDLNERFKVYTTYCTSYPEAISLLTSLLQTSNTNALLTSTQKQLRHTLPLGSYLLKPVQRILKYHLLLDNVRKYCENSETAKAYEIMRDVARNIDQVKKKLEQQNRVKELSGILDGWLGPELTVLGELRLEGLLMENTKPRMVFLFETMLIITKPKEDNRLQFKSYIYRNNLMLTEHLPGEPTSFNVIPYHEPRNLTKLTARNREQKKLWALNIKSVIIENLDIPSRAKELVFKLGDEEDRTPDKIPRKWSLNTSTPTPVYLERRNQYRRSEIKNRSRIKRKTVTNSSSFDALNNTKPKLLERKRSIDDNFITSLSSDIPNMNLNDQNSEDQKSVCNDDECNNNDNCNHINQKLDSKQNNSDVRRNKSKYTKEMKNLVPRSNSANSRTAAESDEDVMSQNENRAKKVEVKMYNAKTMPKRIATLKKNRANKKETATFYMDISEFNDTVLKITESSENLNEISQATQDVSENDQKKDEDENDKNRISCDETESTTVEQSNNQNDEIKIDTTNEISIKKEKDAEIICALLKESQLFEKRLNKSPRKKSIDNGRTAISTDIRKTFLTPPPPPPPRSSPPPLEIEKTKTKRQISDPGPTEIDEPIYETLLRNVHVPYKFSPVLNRSKSQQYYRPNKIKQQLSQRPESDYVTLVYDKAGSLENTFVNQIKFDDTLRNSDSSINYQTTGLKNETISSSNQSNSSQNDFVETFTRNSIKIPADIAIQKQQKSLVQRLKPTGDSSFLPRMIKSVDNINQSYKKKPPERRVSDVAEMCRRQSIIHKQGGEALGERMAHQDYVDPKTLFHSISSNSSAFSLNNHQRDSVFSLTSSSDSVSTGIKKPSTQFQHFTTQNSNDNNKMNKSHHEDPNSTHFNYEDSVENCLENDFRDSAIYSDDNIERRQENYFDFMDTLNTTLIAKPSFLYKNNKNNNSNINDNSQQINNKVNLKFSNKLDTSDNNCQLSSPPPPILSPKPTALPKRTVLSSRSLADTKRSI